MNCPRCNAENADHARFCANCGQPLTPQTASLQPIPPTTSAPPSAVSAITSPDPNIAFVLDVLLGIIGFLGVGWMYAGQITTGAILLIGWWVFMALGIGGSLLTACVGFCLWLPIQLVAPFISALILRNRLQPPNPFRSTFPN